MKEIKLSNGMTTKVDDSDYEWLSGMGNWHCDRYAYLSVQRNNKRRSIRMHRVITDAPKGMDVDHINGDRLDNRRENLRIVDRSTNIRNQPTRKSYDAPAGVYWDKSRKKWKAYTSFKGKGYNLGRFDSKEEATERYMSFIDEMGIEPSRR